MRYEELTSLPSTAEEAKNSMVDLITVYFSKNEPHIPMNDVLDMLRIEGYDLTPGMVMDILNGNRMIKRITKEKIELNNSDTTDMISDKEKEKTKKHVEKMAKKAIKTDIGKR